MNVKFIHQKPFCDFEFEKLRKMKTNSITLRNSSCTKPNGILRYSFEYARV